MNSHFALNDLTYSDVLKCVNNRMASEHETKYPQISSNFQFLFFNLFVFSFPDRCLYKKHPLRKLNIEMSTESQRKINFMFFLKRADLKSNIYCLYGNEGIAWSH